MHGKSIGTKLCAILYRFLIPFVVHMCVVTNWVSVAFGEPVTFRFEAKLMEPQGPLFPVPLGQQVSGTYTFELSTPAMLFNANSAAVYDNALRDFHVDLLGFGIGTSNTGSISIGNPIQTSGSYNFLSDQYVVYGDVTGITLPTAFGDRHLVSAQIRLQDLDQTGLNSTDLSPTPPVLEFFLDHTGPNYDADHADLYLTFDSPFGGVNSTPFQLTLLAAVPEPGTVLLAVVGISAIFIACRKSPST